mgnify:CR=1 FL=1
MRPRPWATCDRCGARTTERGNGLANRCEACRVNLEDFAGRVLEILALETLPASFDSPDKIGAVRNAARALGLLETPDERAHRTAPPEGSRYCDSQPDPEEVS